MKGISTVPIFRCIYFLIQTYLHVIAYIACTKYVSKIGKQTSLPYYGVIAEEEEQVQLRVSVKS
jgi:hypothetical protein